MAAEELSLPTLGPLVKGPYTAEALASRAQELLDEIGDRLRLRDVEGVHGLLAPSFVGHGFIGGERGPEKDLGAGVRCFEVQRGRPAGLRREAWARELLTVIETWTELTHSEWDLLEADFERAEAGGRGIVLAKARLGGRSVSGSSRVLERRLRLLLEGAGEGLFLAGLEWVAGQEFEASRPALVEVTTSSGLGLTGARYGQPGNDREGWNGAAVADFNGDGWLDLVLPSPESLRLYQSQRGERFIEVGEASGLSGHAGVTGLCSADFDKDGDQDLVLAGMGWSLRTREGGAGLLLLENDGSAHFREVGESAGLGRPMPAMGVTVADFDGDGWLDIFVAGYGSHAEAVNDNWMEARNGAPDRLLLGQPGLAFRDATLEFGLVDRDWTVGALALDFDGDGDQDLLTLNHFGPQRAWRNEGGRRFEPANEVLGGLDSRLVFGGLVEDLDGDGLLDIYLTGASSGTGRRLLRRAGVEERSALGGLRALAAGNRLLKGTGRDFVIQASSGAESAGWAWGAASLDLDQDGRRDLACANGFVTGDLPEDT